MIFKNRGSDKFKKVKAERRDNLNIHLIDFIDFSSIGKAQQKMFLTKVQEFIDKLYSLNPFEIMCVTCNIFSHNPQMLTIFDLNVAYGYDNFYSTFLHELAKDKCGENNYTINVSDYCDVILKFLEVYTDYNFVPTLTSYAADNEWSELYLIRELDIYECAHLNGVAFTITFLNVLGSYLREGVTEFLDDNGPDWDCVSYKEFLMSNLKSLTLSKDIISKILSEKSMPVEWAVELHSDLFKSDFTKQLEDNFLIMKEGGKTSK